MRSVLEKEFGLLQKALKKELAQVRARQVLDNLAVLDSVLNTN